MRIMCPRHARLGVGVLVSLLAFNDASAQLVYNAGLDARAKAALEQYEASKKAHLAYLDSRLGEVDQQQAVLTNAATEALIAERDRLATTILGEDERKEAAGRLRGAIAARMDAIIPELITAQGCTENGCRGGKLIRGADFDRVRAVLPQLDAPRSDNLRLAESELQLTEAELTKLLGQRRPTGDRRLPAAGWSLGWFCRDVFPRQTEQIDAFKQEMLVGREGLNATDAHNFVLVASGRCPQIAAAHFAPRFEDIRNRSTRRALLALGGWGDDDSGAPVDEARSVDPILPTAELGRQILVVRTRTAALKLELETANAIARALKKKRDDLIKAWATNASQDELDRVASCITQLLGDRAEAACVKDASGATDHSVESLFSAITVLTNLADAGPDLQRIRQEEAFEVVQYLTDPIALRAKAQASCFPVPPGAALAAAAPATEDEAEDRLRRLCITDAVVRTAGIVERAGEIRRGVPGEIAALAVQLADAELKAANIRLRAAALADRAASLDAQRRALLGEIKSLMEVFVGDAQAANTDRARLDRGVYRLADSFGHGRLGYEVEAVRYGFIGQREFGQRERAIATGRYAISDALLSTLASSTAGGIKPEQVAGIIATVGLTTVGVLEAVK